MEHSQKILNFMDSRGVSAYKLSKATGISESTFSKWRNKPTSKIDTTTLEKIASYFQVSTDFLLGKEEIKKAPAEAEAGDDFLFALSGEVKEFTDEQKQDILDYAKFLKQKYNIK